MPKGRLSFPFLKKIMTKNYVEYNLEVSPFKFETNGIEFVFSSLSHREKFIKKADQAIKEVNDSLSKRFNMTVDTQHIGLIRLYTQIETRGFLFYFNDEVFTCLNQVKFVGRILTKGL